MSELELMKKSKRMLVVVDMVKGFVTEGALASERVERIVPDCVRLVEDALAHGDSVVFVKDCHTENSVEFKSFPPHCIKGTREAEMVDELISYEDKVFVVEKNAISVIASKYYNEILDSSSNLELVDFIGCEADMCVLGASIPTKSKFDNENRDVKVRALMEAVETFDADFHPGDDSLNMAYKVMSGVGVELVKKYERGNKNGK